MDILKIVGPAGAWFAGIAFLAQLITNVILAARSKFLQQRCRDLERRAQRLNRIEQPYIDLLDWMLRTKERAAVGGYLDQLPPDPPSLTRLREWDSQQPVEHESPDSTVTDMLFPRRDQRPGSR